jgi:hypothetical protein
MNYLQPSDKAETWELVSVSEVAANKAVMARVSSTFR